MVSLTFLWLPLIRNTTFLTGTEFPIYASNRQWLEINACPKLVDGRWKRWISCYLGTMNNAMNNIFHKEYIIRSTLWNDPITEYPQNAHTFLQFVSFILYIYTTVHVWVFFATYPWWQEISCSACHHTLSGNHWHRLLKIPAIIGVKSNITTFNYVCRFCVNMCYSGRNRFNEFNHADMKDVK